MTAGRSRRRTYLRELAAGIGREGAWALFTIGCCIAVTTAGIVAVAATWQSTDVVEVFTLLGVDVTLPAAWIAYLGGVGVAGWLVSGQVSKKSVRGFVGVSILLGGLLLVTVGRNVRIEESVTTARTAARQLDEVIAGRPSGTASVAQTTLVSRLCELGDEECRVDPVGAPVGELPDEIGDASLRTCLPGWTLSAFEKWRLEASLDREVAATTALARCVLDAFDPGADLGEPAEADVAAEAPTEGSESDTPRSEATIVRDTTNQALEDARAAVTEALRVQRSEANLFETIAKGADGVLSSVSGPADFAEFRFSGATWLVILGLSLLWYRNLEIRAGRGVLGPVDIRFDAEGGDTAGGDDAASDLAAVTNFDEATQRGGQAIFKQAVVQNVPEPGAVPGAHALAPVGDLVAATATSHGRVVDAVIQVVQAVLATQSGFSVLYAAHRENDIRRGSASAPSSVVFVRIRDTRTGTQLASMRFASEHLEESAQLAGYWVAGWIIARSRSVPGWARWSESDARAFHSLQWRQGDDLHLQTRGAVDPVSIDATSGNCLILAQRAYAYQISADGGGPYVFNALEDFARAAHRQPRYPVARYRRAAALSALMGDDVDLRRVFRPRVGEAELPSKSRLSHLFRDLIGCDDPRLDAWVDQIHEDGRFPQEMRRAMFDVVDAWIDAGRDGVRVGRYARARPSERRFWRHFRATGVQSDWMRLIHTSECIVAERRRGVFDDGSVDPGVVPAESVVARAKEPGSHWQLSYNLACYHALVAGHVVDDADRRGHLKEAFAWLERSLDRRFSGQLVREWAERDPDLAILRTSDDPEDRREWTRWVRRVPRLPVVFRLGDENDRVLHLQTRLAVVDPGPPIAEDGVYGEATVAAIRRFQRPRGLTIDGVPDAVTLAQLEAEFDERIEQVTSQLERLGHRHLGEGREVGDDLLGRPLRAAVRDFQRRCGLEPTGIPGPRTAELLQLAASPEDLDRLLEALRRTCPDLDLGGGDGIGPDTVRAIERFQTEHGLVVDGIYGRATRTALDELADLPGT